MTFNRGEIDDAAATALQWDVMIEWGYSYSDLVGMSDLEFRYQYKVAEARRAARRELERQAGVQRGSKGKGKGNKGF